MSVLAKPFRTTSFGFRVWPGSFLKLYFPFIISGTTAFFLFSYAHTKLMDAPDDKWTRIVENVRVSTANQAKKAQATAYLEKHPEGSH